MVRGAAILGSIIRGEPSNVASCHQRGPRGCSEELDRLANRVREIAKPGCSGLEFLEYINTVLYREEKFQLFASTESYYEMNNSCLAKVLDIERTRTSQGKFGIPITICIVS